MLHKFKQLYNQFQKGNYTGTCIEAITLHRSLLILLHWYRFHIIAPTSRQLTLKFTHIKELISPVKGDCDWNKIMACVSSDYKSEYIENQWITSGGHPRLRCPWGPSWSTQNAKHKHAMLEITTQRSPQDTITTTCSRCIYRGIQRDLAALYASSLTAGVFWFLLPTVFDVVQQDLNCPVTVTHRIKVSMWNE